MAPDPFARQHRNWAQWFGAGWEDVRAATVARAELDALLALPATALIHNDLYRDNILRAGDRWVVIDPKPVLSDPHAECFGLLAAAEYVTDLAILERYARPRTCPTRGCWRGGCGSAR